MWCALACCKPVLFPFIHRTLTMFDTPSQGGRGGGMPPDVPSHGWTQHTAPDGHLYYFNVMTGTSQWERPLELDFPMAGKGGGR